MGAERNAVEARIRELYEKHGTITPDIVIKDARKESSPLHGQFEWDVEKAALEAWRDTARRLIRSVRVVVSVEEISFDAKSRPAPEFVRDPEANSDVQGYKRAAELRSSNDIAMAALMYEIDRADGAINRAKEVAEALGVRDEIEFVSSAILRVRKKAKGAA